MSNLFPLGQDFPQEVLSWRNPLVCMDAMERLMESQTCLVCTYALHISFESPCFVFGDPEELAQEDEQLQSYDVNVPDGILPGMQWG